MSGTEAAAAVASVPADMISNILERVDLVSLFRCSLVCKEWRSLLSDPAFLPGRGQSQSQSSASLLGIFVQRGRPRKTSELFPNTAPVLVPAPGSVSVLGPQLRFLTSFVRDDDAILDDAIPLAARDGLLLVRVWRPRASTDMQNSGGGDLLRLCVCNLLTGKRDLLPALDVAATFHADGVQGYAVLTADDGTCPTDGYITLFQVLLVGRGHAKEEPLHLLRFTSASGEWDTLDCSQINLGVRGLWAPKGYRVAAVAHGTAHWLFQRNGRYITLDVSASTGRVSITAIPVDAEVAMRRAARSYKYKPWWLCTTAEGMLALLCMENKNRLVMMKQRDDDVDHHWDSNNVAEVHVDVEESLNIVSFGDRSGTALARSRIDPEWRAYVLDIDLQSCAASATKVEGWIRNFNYKTAAPFEINWAMFFLSRLGVQQ